MGSSHRWCSDCETHHWSGEQCHPIWLVVPLDCDYTIDDAWKIRAETRRKAAEVFGDRWDCGGDYTIVGGDDMTVDVYSSPDDTPERFVVMGEAVPQYTARRVVVPEQRPAEGINKEQMQWVR